MSTEIAPRAEQETTSFRRPDEYIVGKAVGAVVFLAGAALGIAGIVESVQERSAASPAELKLGGIALVAGAYVYSLFRKEEQSEQ